MIDKTMIDRVKDRLVDAFDPVAIYLFGSYAWGNPDEESDLDILIVTDKYTKNRYMMMADGHRALRGLDIAKDILLYSKDDFDRFAADKISFCSKIARDGKMIYAKA